MGPLFEGFLESETTPSQLQDQIRQVSRGELHPRIEESSSGRIKIKIIYVRGNNAYYINILVEFFK